MCDLKEFSNWKKIQALSEESKIKRNDSATPFVIMMFPARLRALNLTLNHARDAAHTRADIPSLDELYHRRIRAWNPKSGKAALSRDLPVSPCRADRATENPFHTMLKLPGKSEKNALARVINFPFVSHYRPFIPRVQKVSIIDIFQSCSEISNKYFSRKMCVGILKASSRRKSYRIYLKCNRVIICTRIHSLSFSFGEKFSVFMTIITCYNDDYYYYCILLLVITICSSIKFDIKNDEIIIVIIKMVSIIVS